MGCVPPTRLAICVLILAKCLWCAVDPDDGICVGRGVGIDPLLTPFVASAAS